MNPRHVLALATLAFPFLALPAEAQTYQQAATRPSTSAKKLGTLVNSPSSLVVVQVGSTQQLRVFLDDGMNRIEVTNDPGTTYQSSDRGVVSVSAAGMMTFNGIGQADVAASYDKSTAHTAVDVDPAKLPSVESMVGPAGGAVHFADGTGIEVPPGVLTSSQTIGVEEVPLPSGAVLPVDSAVVSNTFDFQPSGLTFPAEVEVTIAYSTSNIPFGYGEESLLIHTMYGGNHLDVESYPGPEDNELESVNQSMDLVNRTVTMGVRHFSERALLARLAPANVVLVAPDGTQLDVLQVLKAQKPSSGADGCYGVANCDDNGDGNIDDCGEFQGVGGAACVGPVDDANVAIPTRVSANITHIVLHCTAGAAGATFDGEVSWASNARNCYWAQYYVGRDGTIVQVSQDTDIAQQVKTNNTAGHAGNGINNDDSIGIEIFHNTGVDNYSGRQLAAVVRLCDFLIRSHPTIVRPSAANPTGNIITHAAQNPPGSVKTDPTDQFRTTMMGSPSLEDIVRRALRTDTLTGIINARGGDALGTGFPGSGGNVTLEMGVGSLANRNYNDNFASTQVPAGATGAVGGPNLMHLLVDGTAFLSADTALDLEGILYVGPQGVLDARGGFDGDDGFDLTISADGLRADRGRDPGQRHRQTGRQRAAPLQSASLRVRLRRW